MIGNKLEYPSGITDRSDRHQSDYLRFALGMRRQIAVVSPSFRRRIVFEFEKSFFFSNLNRIRRRVDVAYRGRIEDDLSSKIEFANRLRFDGEGKAYIDVESRRRFDGNTTSIRRRLRRFCANFVVLSPSICEGETMSHFDGESKAI